MKRKILFIAVMIMMAVLLVSCGGGSNTKAELIYINAPEAELSYDGEAPTVQNLNITNLEIIVVAFDGSTRVVDNTTIIKDTTITKLPSNNNIASYQFLIDGKLGILKVVENKATGDDTPALLVPIYRVANDETDVKANVVYPQGQKLVAEDIEFIAVNHNGSTKKVSAEINDNNHEVIEGKSFFNEKNYRVTASYQGISADFNIRVAGGAKPIHTKTASFFPMILQIPIAFLMSFIGSFTGHSFALAILLTTIIVRSLAWPIYAKSNDLSLKMKVANPDIQRLQLKYAGRTDEASRQKMQMEMMQIYKKHNINMLGCFLPFLQMPIFIGMYNVVTRISLPGGQFGQNVSNTMLFGIDLAGKLNFVNYIFALLVGATMALLNYLSMKKPKNMKKTSSHYVDEKALQQEKTMKYVNYFMIIMMVMASLSSKSLAFYWIVGNIYSILQNLLTRKLRENKEAKLLNKDILYKG